MYCPECGSALADSYKFCFHCGHAVKSAQSISADRHDGPFVLNDPGPSSASLPSRIYLIGTIVFTAFSAMTLLIGLAKGLTILGISETIGWAVAAWYWQRKKPSRKEVIIGIILLAASVVVGEIVFKSNPAAHSKPTENPFDAVFGYIPPDRASLSPPEEAASCRFGYRLSKRCIDYGLRPSLPLSSGFAHVPLGKIKVAPQESSHWVPDQADCDIAFGWKNYCDARSR